MVARLWIFLLCLSFVWRWAEASPLVEASIDAMNAQAHYPLDGIITITHKNEEKIEPGSFTMEGKRLEVSLAKEVLMSASSDTLVAIYNFQLPAKDQGLYVLPEISVKIGDQTYQSVPSSYEVKGGNPPQAAPSNAPADSTTPLIFRLEAAVQGPSTLYPGERTKLTYRISYNRSIDLTKSDLPMIHPAHFQKVGDVQIRDKQEQTVTVQELTQEVEASDIGTFTFGPSVIEGYAYTMKGIQKVYSQALLHATAPVVTVEVKPFPQLQQPASFTGAIGAIQAEASLESPSAVSVGDTVQLLVKVQGIANLEELRLPLLQCQPGFSGFFQTSDLPPLAEVKGESKFFHIEMRPMTSLIQQIPPIELSSFDPTTGHYAIQKTNPIPLTVSAHPAEKTPPLTAPLLASFPVVDHWPTPDLTPLEFETEPIYSRAMKGHWQGALIFWLIPFGLGLLLLQNRLHRYIQQRPRVKIPKSEELWQQASRLDFSKQRHALFILEQAFWHRLWEKGALKAGDFDLDLLPQDDKFKSVRSFLLQLQALQYSSEKEFNASQLKQTARKLFPLI